MHIGILLLDKYSMLKKILVVLFLAFNLYGTSIAADDIGESTPIGSNIGETDQVSSISDSSGGRSPANYILTATADPNITLRNTTVVLNLTLKNTEKSKALKIQSISFDISPKFKLNLLTQENNLNDDFFEHSGRKVTIYPFEINKSETKSFYLEVFIPRDVDAIDSELVSNLKLSIKNHRRNPSNEHNYAYIKIQNNKPKIDSANVDVPVHHIKSNYNTLLYIGDNNNSIDLGCNISAHDVEDGNKLNMFGIVRDQNDIDIQEDNLESPNILRLNIKNLSQGRKYSVWIKVKDKNNATYEEKANITCGGKSYDNIMVPDEHFNEGAALVFSTLLSIIVGIITYVLFVSTKYHKYCRYFGLLFSLFIIGSYIKFFNSDPICIYNDLLYFNSVPILEMTIYIITLSIIVYFVEVISSLDLEDIPHHSMFIIILVMLIILAIFMHLLPRIPNLSDNISLYFSTLSTIYGTIFTLIVALSGQFPRNIITFDKYNLNGDFFSYHRKLRYFVAMYGTALGLSLLGLISGTNLNLNILITGSDEELRATIISIALFEITFLLIVPIIMSLYNLLKVMSFRGKIIIRSEPPGARIFLSKRINLENARANKNEDPLKDLNLFTPCTLLLPRGTYKLLLKDKEHRIYPEVDVTIMNGQENELIFRKPVTFIYENMVPK